jgi:hypothetical protein
MPDGVHMMELGSYWAFYSIWFAQKLAMQEAIKNNKIGYIFISIHSNQLHEQYKAFWLNITLT